MTNFTIRDARADDAAFVAWVQQEAARSHLPRGFFDLAFPGPDEDRLRIIRRMACAEAKSFCHWSGFLVAEVDGKPAAGLSGYEKASVAAGTELEAAMREALSAERWTHEQAGAMQQRISPFLTCIPETPDDLWVVEWVATRPEHRGKGLIKALLEAILSRGRERGYARSQIGVMIGNTPAQRAYEGAGFRVVDEKRHPDFEAALGCPGIRRMLR
jgi:translation initiation factor 4G